MTAFVATFLVDFFAALFEAFFAASFFEALPAFFTARLLLVAPFLAARFFAAAFLLALAGGDLRAFALRFFEAFFAAVATTNSFIAHRLSGLISGGALPRRIREHPEHRENQRFSL
ncbi:hypothetical protein [Bradyrhizobium australiense]|uniref:hypothetical protein n=1 Tax=Bradyrhizobium australiense TaxID=2721161 RepID=UPI002898FA82|nr:hypothetical protein [Bradyrhizobium australiense]